VVSECARCGEAEATIPEPRETCGISNVQVWCKPCYAEFASDVSWLTPKQRRRTKKRILQGKL
jgi:3-phenylpropionate/cinnamic acid dioxygenase small subunit